MLRAVATEPPTTFPTRIQDHDTVEEIGEGRFACRIGADKVPLQLVAGGRCAADGDAIVVVPRDDVPGEYCRSANQVIRRAVCDAESETEIAQVERSADVGADEVSLYEIPGGARVVDPHSRIEVPGDDVARTRDRASDDVTARPLRDPNADEAVADAGGSMPVGADEVAANGVAVRPISGDVHTVEIVAGDDVAGRCRRSADKVSRRAFRDKHPHVGIAEIGGSVGGRADEVPLHLVAGCTRAGDDYSAEVVPRDQVSEPNRVAADRDIVSAAEDAHAVTVVAEVNRTGPVRADEASGDVAVVCPDLNAVAVEAVDDESANHCERRRCIHDKSVSAGPCSRSVELDQWERDEAGLSVALDGNLAGDRGQGAGEVDGPHPHSGDVELDRVGPGGGVGGEDGVA